jgi:hypothetical protein
MSGMTWTPRASRRASASGLVGPGAVGVVVLDPVALEEPVGAVVYLDGEVDDDLVLRLGEDRPHHRVEVDGVGAAVELEQRDLVEVEPATHNARFLATRWGAAPSGSRSRVACATPLPPGIEEAIL